jgi:hypothetical protein
MEYEKLTLTGYSIENSVFIGIVNKFGAAKYLPTNNVGALIAKRQKFES